MKVLCMKSNSCLQEWRDICEPWFFFKNNIEKSLVSHQKDLILFHSSALYYYCTSPENKWTVLDQSKTSERTKINATHSGPQIECESSQACGYWSAFVLFPSAAERMALAKGLWALMCKSVIKPNQEEKQLIWDNSQGWMSNTEDCNLLALGKLTRCILRAEHLGPD